MSEIFIPVCSAVFLYGEGSASQEVEDGLSVCDQPLLSGIIHYAQIVLQHLHPPSTALLLKTGHSSLAIQMEPLHNPSLAHSCFPFQDKTYSSILQVYGHGYLLKYVKIFNQSCCRLTNSNQLMADDLGSFLLNSSICNRLEQFVVMWRKEVILA